jgi:zinc and cadmium transporter
MLTWIILFSLSGTFGVIVAISVFYAASKKFKKMITPLISYAAGTLLAAALLGLLPHSLEDTTSSSVLSAVLAGIILFFLLEKIVLWRHCHNIDCEVHKAAGPMILLGDTIHNLTDGVIIAASFLGSLPLGITASLSVIAHEIPQEVGDFAILLHSGYATKKALLLNVLSSLSTLPAAVTAYYALEAVESVIPYIMAVAAASFIYIALADLSPELHREIGLTHTIQQVLFMMAGVATIIVLLHIHQ